MTTEEAIKEFKNYFPDDVEVIVLTKEYYAKELGQLQFENIILRDRIDKAIEYIEERKTLNWYADGVFVEELLDILEGDNNE